MPDLSPEEYDELKRDIAARGVMVPVELDEHQNILDGHHRVRICQELGIKDYPKIIRAGMTEEEKRLHARKLNMARRHLTQETRRELIRQQLRETPEKSDAQLAKGLGVSDKTVAKQRQDMESTSEIPKLDTRVGADGKERRRPVSIYNPTRREEKAIQNPAVVERMAEEGKSVLTAAKEVAREEKAERKSYTLPDKLPCQLYIADIRDGLPMVADESIDFIITDPPYSKEYIPLYMDLNILASRVLKPGGSLLVMTGQSYLPDVITLIAPGMGYHWCLAYTTPGGQSPQLWGKRVNTFWKPVLWYAKGGYNGDYIGDVIRSPPNDNDKAYHKWGQSLGGMRDIIKRFTNPGDIILDPFLGGGTTGAAAVSMGRQFIGADIDQKSVDIAEQRIREVYADARSQTGEDRMA